MARVKVTQNQHGNFTGHVGAMRVPLGDEEWHATRWLAERLTEGHVLSDKFSDVTLAMVEAWRLKNE